MSRNGRFKYDETKFKPKQREAAIAMVEYEFSERKERPTKQEIADSLNISRKTLHNWEFHDPNFIAYKNQLASEYMDSHLAFVYKKLLEGINNGSMRGIEAFLKRIGDMDSKSEVTVRQEGDVASLEDRRAAILERLGEEGGSKDGGADE